MSEFGETVAAPMYIMHGLPLVYAKQQIYLKKYFQYQKSSNCVADSIWFDVLIYANRCTHMDVFSVRVHINGIFHDDQSMSDVISPVGLFLEGLRSHRQLSFRTFCPNLQIDASTNSFRCQISVIFAADFGVYLWMRKKINNNGMIHMTQWNVYS